MYDRPPGRLPSRDAVNVLATIAEDDTVVADSVTTHAQKQKALRAELRHWSATWQALPDAYNCATREQLTMHQAVQGWCAHLGRLTQEAMQLEQKGDPAGAAQVIRGFESIYGGCYKIMSNRDWIGAARFLDARTALMQRLVGGEFSPRLRTLSALETRALDETLALLCRCENPGNGMQLLRETQRLLGLSVSPPRPPDFNPAVPPPPLTAPPAAAVAPVNAPPATRPGHPAPASPPLRAHH